MWYQIVILFVVFVTHSGCSEDVSETTTTNVDLAEGEKKISEYILIVLDHFKQPDPVGLPGAEIPDPYPISDMQHSLSLGTTMYLKNSALYGIKKFRIIDVNAEISEMKVRASMIIDNLQARGNYTMALMWQSQQGPYTVDIGGLKIIAHASLGVERDGKIRAQDITIDLDFETISVNFENLGFLAYVMQGIINTAGNIIFDSIKPQILKESYAKARTEINKKLEEFSGDIQFPNSISPLDMVVADIRKKVRDMGKDPYQVKDYNATVSVFAVTLSNTWITGVSSFQRVGNMTLKIENNTVIADFEVGTQKLDGRTQWEVSAVNGLMTRAGTASFSVEYITARIILAQPLDTRKKPEFRDLYLEVGNIQVRWNGAGTLDYVIELMVNILPNLLRYQIMHALEGPIKEKVQLELNEINVEEMITQELPKIDEMSEKGFKLSSIIKTETKEEAFDDDDFFNF